jgi:FemAB-related protein (PEP-CTERM system-associated)
MLTATPRAADPLPVRPGTASGPLTIASAFDPVEWDGFVNAQPDACGYHLAAWRGVFERAFGHRPEYLTARRAGQIVGVLPLVEMRSWLLGNFFVSLPFVNYGGVLTNDDEAARALADYAEALARERGLKHVELRHRRAPRFPGGPCKQHKVTMLLPLAADADAMWNALDRKVRNQVRKAEKSELTSVVGGAELIDEFYPVFATNMRDLGTPVYGKRVFEEIFKALPGHTSMFVVRKGTTTVAAGVGYSYRTTFEMPWASSLKEHRALSPNNLLYWHAIRHAIATGHRVFDFGRSTPDEGTYHFKRQWGAEAEPLFWEYRLPGGGALPDQSPKNPKFSLAISLWKKLPVPIATLIGPSIVRSIP